MVVVMEPAEPLAIKYVGNWSTWLIEEFDLPIWEEIESHKQRMYPMYAPIEDEI